MSACLSEAISHSYSSSPPPPPPAPVASTLHQRIRKTSRTINRYIDLEYVSTTAPARAEPARSSNFISFLPLVHPSFRYSCLSLHYTSFPFISPSCCPAFPRLFRTSVFLPRVT